MAHVPHIGEALPLASPARVHQARYAEIRHDIATIGREATVAKWGMSMDWTYRAIPAGKNRKPREKMRQTAPSTPLPATLTEAIGTPQTPQQTAQHMPGNGHSPLPPWRDDWKSVVQIEWLRASRDIEVARIGAAR